MQPFLHPRYDTMIELPGASDALRELAARGVRHAYKKGKLLIEEGDMAGPIYIVLSGRLRVFSKDTERDRELTFGSYGPGEYVGEMSLDGGPRSANVETLERSECVLISRATLTAFIAEHPEFAFELLAKVISRARVATLTARQMALNDCYGRLRLTLEAVAETVTDGDRWIAEPPTHLALSRRIGCTRPMVSRLLKDLERGRFLVHADGGWRLKGTLPARW